MALVEEIRELREEVRKQNALGEAYRAEINVLHEQINGERGISATLNKQTDAIDSLRKGAYWVAGLIVASSIGFAFSVLTLIH